jgi:hypothetical protein
LELVNNVALLLVAHSVCDTNGEETIHIISARKADKAVELSLERVKQLKESLKSKGYYLSVKRKTCGMEPVLFDLLAEGQSISSSEDVAEQIESLSKDIQPTEENMSPVFQAIRNVQKQRAEDLGRTHGLLVKTHG